MASKTEDLNLPQPKTKEAWEKLLSDPDKDSIVKVRSIVHTLDKKFAPVPEQSKPKQAEEKEQKEGEEPKKKLEEGEKKAKRGKKTKKKLEEGEKRAKEGGKPKDEEKKPEEGEKNSIQKLQRNLWLLQMDVKKVRELNTEVADEVEKQIEPLKLLLAKAVAQSATDKLTKGMKKDVEDINKKIFKLMCEVPLLPNKRRKPGASDADDGDGDNNGKGVFCLPGIHTNEEDLKTRAVFKFVEDKFKKLPTDRQIYLLSFAVFPENQEVNRTMLMYWWIGEDILPVIGAEDAVKKILQEFVDKNLIEEVENKRKVDPNCYKMNPFVHSSLVLISKEIGLFDMYRKGDKPSMKKSTLHKVCLVDGSSSQAEAKANKMDANDIETVFNVSERFPDFTFKWFSAEQQSKNKVFRNRLKKVEYLALKVFYLGRWERTAKRHIEIENPEHMKYLKHMIKLRLLSFQGISRIETLDDAVCKLHELIILDLRACYNLEKLPDKINLLRGLIYLDITDCYMIDRMPKRLSWLAKLEVLKGFVVSDAQGDTVCTLAELKELKNLRKLSITINKVKYTVKQLFIDIAGFVDKEKKDIAGFEKLEKLKVAWGGINEHNKKEETGGGLIGRTATYLLGKEAAVVNPEEQKDPVLPKSLRKLDLQCFPDPELPKWLEPQQLKHLEKLYIKGGMELVRFGKSTTPPERPTECNVKVLRLKFLPRLNVEWRDLKELYFPKLEFLDKYQCPQVSLCPCDGIGIWRGPKKHGV